MKQKFTIKTNSPSANLNKPHFYVLSKGLNSGKPLDTPCPNCFIVTTRNEALKEQLYWLCHSLWQLKTLHKHLRGSVIPFISIVEFRKVLSLNFEEVVKDEPRFKKSVQALQALDKKQCQYSENIRLIEEAKRIVMYRYIKRR